MPEPDTPLVERPWEAVERMVTVDRALGRVLAAVHPLPGVETPILDALGYVASRGIVAATPVPPFRNSAMDGYAVRAADTAEASSTHPTMLRLTGSAAAGSAIAQRVEAGTAVRIMTGAPMPDGADAVVRFEETDEVAYGPNRADRIDRGEIGIVHAARPGDNVREAGEDVASGDLVLAAGQRIRPAEIGLLAALNRATAEIHRPPVVAILSTGDEIVGAGPALLPGQIRDVNSPMLAAMVKRAGGVPVMLGVARDVVADLSEKLAAARGADLIVSTGGVSLGDYDVVKDVLRASGEIAIWQVRMKPGKPLAWGLLDGVPFLGLPGNPVAAVVSFEQFGLPAIRRMLGRSDLATPEIDAVLTERVDNRGQRRHFVRARVEGSISAGFTVRPAGDQGAGVISSLARANGLLVVPETLDVAEPGMTLRVQMVDWLGAL